MTAAISSPPRRIAAALSSLILAVLLTVGVPVLLWQLAGWPLPGKLPSPDGIGRALSRSSVSDLVIIKTLALVGWGAWLLLCWSLVVETWAWVRGRPAAQVRLAGPIQVLARQIVTTVSLVAVTGMSSASPHTVAATSSGATLIVEHQPPPAPVVVNPATAPIAGTVAASGTYTVQRRDSLWAIAKCQLGDPLRWREIWDLNKDREFNGVKFTNANLIYPGWVLALPPDSLAAGPTPPPQPPAAAAEPALDPSTPTATTETTTTTTAAPVTTTAMPSAPTTSGAVTGPTDPSDLHDPASDDDEEESRAPLFAGGIALATALLLMLNRLRRSQSRRRHPGRAPYRAPIETAATEMSLRRSADPPRMQRLTAALRAFASGVGGSTLPELAAVRVTPDEVELLLGSPTRHTPPGFEDRGELRAFATEPQITTATLEGLASDTPSPWPAVVTVGSIGNDLVLIDLETAGILTVDGDEAVDTVRRIAAELAASPVSELIELVIVGDEFDLATSDRVRSASTIGDAIDVLTVAAESTRTALDQLGDADTTIARRDHSSEQGWEVTILVCLSPLSKPDQQRLAGTATPRCGTAAVVVGRALSVGWSLTAGATAHLTPHGFELDPLVLPREDLAAVGGLLSDAAVGDSEGALLADPSSEVVTSDVFVPQGIEPSPTHPEVDIEVRVLGPVEVHGVPPINRRRTVELITYLALHQQGVTASQLKTAIWPEGMPSQDTFNVTVHRARASLSLDRDGKHHLPHAVTSDFGYTVGPHVTTDLARFTTLVNRSRSAADADEETELLRQALDLLRGQPFEGVSGYDWAFTEGTIVESEAMIADAAHRLAQVALAGGDAELVTWAAMQGLKAVPGSEPLYRDRMEAAHLNGDPAAVDRIVEELCRYIETLDPLDDLHPDTIELWHRIGRPSSEGSRDNESAT